MPAVVHVGPHRCGFAAGHDIALTVNVALRQTQRMTNSQRLAKVRARLADWLLSHGTDSVIESESILIRNEFYCGRRFSMKTHHAVWFIEEDELKIYQQDGQLVDVLHSEEIDVRVEDQAQQDDEPRVIKLPQPAENDQTRRAA